MTEERIKEIMGLWGENGQVLRRACIVAAEAREEGIEEAYRAGYEEAAGAPEELENCLYEWLKEKGG